MAEIGIRNGSCPSNGKSIPIVNADPQQCSFYQALISGPGLVPTGADAAEAALHHRPQLLGHTQQRADDPGSGYRCADTLVVDPWNAGALNHPTLSMGGVITVSLFVRTRAKSAGKNADKYGRTAGVRPNTQC